MSDNRKARLFTVLDSLSYLNRSFGGLKKHNSVLVFPRVVQVQTQSFCNGQCTICPYPSVKDTQKNGFMKRELFENIVRQSVQEPLCAYMAFTFQNEPLLDKEIFQKVRFFKALNKEKTAVIITNAELLGEFDAEEIVQSNLDSLVISLNAHSEATFNVINKGVNYQKVMENINRVLSNPVLKQKVRLRFVLTRMNEKEVTDALDFWKKKGVKTIVAHLGNRAGLLKEYSRYKMPSLRGRPLWNLEKRLWRYYEGTFLKGCFRPFFYMCVLFNGDVILCCNDWRRQSVVGNVERDPLKSVWNSEAMNAMRWSILEKSYGRNMPCRDCEKNCSGV